MNALVLALAERLTAAAVAGVVEVVPTFRSLTIHYDPLAVSHRELKEQLAPLLSGAARGRRLRPAVAHPGLLP